MLKPDLIEFKPKELAKSEEVNYNFTQMGNYVFGSVDELKALVNSTVANLTLQLNQSVFTGKIEMYAGNADDIPVGWLLCDGRAVSRETYSNLYTKIGTKYGKGNGTTTFNVPNYIGRFLEGGTEAGIVKEAGLPNITGDFYSGNRDMSGYPSTGSFSNTGAIRGNANFSSGSQTHAYQIGFDASRSNAIYGRSNTVQPPAITVLYIIKT